MVPYGHTFVAPPNYYELMSIGLKGRDAISTRNGTDYTVGAIYNVMCKFYIVIWQHDTRVILFKWILDESAGSSIDWAYGLNNVTLLYAFEFRDIWEGNCFYCN